MAVQYQVDGNTFWEITTNWFSAHVSEFLIKARRLDTDQAGNTIEYFQLNDGRVFTRLIPSAQAVDVPKASNTSPRNMRPAIGEHSVT